MEYQIQDNEVIFDESTNLFDDDGEETETSEVAEEETADDHHEAGEETTEETNEEPVSSDEPFLNVRFNHEDVALTKDDTIMMAQKGLNYDNLEKRLNSALSELEEARRYRDAYGKLEHMAELVGADVPTYLSRLDQLNVATLANAELRKLKLEYPNGEEKLLRSVAMSRAKERMGMLQDERVRETKTRQDAERERLGMMIDHFNERYPGIDATKLDPSVYEAMNRGYTLVEAYGMYLDKVNQAKAEKAEKENKAKEINARNKAKSYGNTGNQAEKEKDDFLEGFFS